MLSFNKDNKCSQGQHDLSLTNNGKQIQIVFG